MSWEDLTHCAELMGEVSPEERRPTARGFLLGRGWESETITAELLESMERAERPEQWRQEDEGGGYHLYTAEYVEIGFPRYATDETDPAVPFVGEEWAIVTRNVRNSELGGYPDVVALRPGDRVVIHDTGENGFAVTANGATFYMPYDAVYDPHQELQIERQGEPIGMYVIQLPIGDRFKEESARAYMTLFGEEE